MFAKASQKMLVIYLLGSCALCLELVAPTYAMQNEKMQQSDGGKEPGKGKRKVSGEQIQTKENLSKKLTELISNKKITEKQVNDILSDIRNIIAHAGNDTSQTEMIQIIKNDILMSFDVQKKLDEMDSGGKIQESLIQIVGDFQKKLEEPDEPQSSILKIEKEEEQEELLPSPISTSGKETDIKIEQDNEGEKLGNKKVSVPPLSLEKILVQKCQTQYNKTFVEFIDHSRSEKTKCQTINTNIGNASETIERAIQMKIASVYDHLKNLQNFYIKKEDLQEILYKYIESNSDAIGLLGQDLSDREKQNFITYMTLCESIYATPTQFDTLEEEKLSNNVKKDWDKIIEQYESLNDIINNLNEINKEHKEATKKGVIRKKNIKGQVVEDIKVLQEEINKDYYDKYKTMMENANEILAKLKLDPVEIGKTIAGISNSIQELEDRLKPFALAYRDLVNTKGKKYEEIREWIFWKKLQEKKEKHDIKPYRGKIITHRAGLKASFLEKIIHKGFGDVTYNDILTIGFRNTEIRKGMQREEWAQFLLTPVLKKWKGNPYAIFADGELDHISFINSQKDKDEIIIAFSGSNSHYDWRQDFQFGTSMSSIGLIVHHGIRGLFETFTLPELRTLLNKLKQHYSQKKTKPKKIEIIVTGHSLGGALALLASYFLKTSKIEKETGVNNISLKVYTYAAPAIIAPESKRAFDNVVGVENVYRIWTDDDPVVYYSLLRLNNTPKVHVGQDYHLIDFFKWKNITSVTGQQHQAETYLTNLNSILNEKITDKEVLNLIGSLDRFVKSDGFHKLKLLLKEILNLQAFLQNKEQNSLNISHELFNRLSLKHSARTQKKLIPETTVEYEPDSPRDQSLGEVIFSKTKPKDTIELKLTDILEEPISLKIASNTDCTVETLKTMLKDPITGEQLSIADDKLKEIECQCTVAKHVFMIPWSEGYLMSTSQTPTGILKKAQKSNHCTKEYLNSVSTKINSTNPYKIVESIVKEVGLAELWKESNITFSVDLKSKKTRSMMGTFDVFLSESFDAKNEKNQELIKTFLSSFKSDKKGLIGKLYYSIQNSGINKTGRSKSFETLKTNILAAYQEYYDRAFKCYKGQGYMRYYCPGLGQSEPEDQTEDITDFLDKNMGNLISSEYEPTQLKEGEIKSKE